MPRALSVATGALLLIVLSAARAPGQESPNEGSPDAPLARPTAPTEQTAPTGARPAFPNALAAPGGPLAAPGSPLAVPGGPLAAPSLPDLVRPDNFSAAMKIIVLLTVLSLAPAILIMTTSFTRIIIVLSLLRQALGTQQLPPNPVLMGLALFMTALVMGPTWARVNSDALQPYTAGTLSQQDALDLGLKPVRLFMIRNIQKSHNDADVLLFSDFAHKPRPHRYADVGTTTLIPAFMLSELKTAFYVGFTVYLPFLIIDIVVSSVLISMGMMMLPPALISLPFKLLMFVLVDGWHLITNNLMVSFAN